MIAKKPNPSDNDLYMEWAKKYPNTIFCQKRFWRYDSGIYQDLSEERIRKEVDQIINAAEPRGARVSPSRTTRIVQLAKDRLATDTHDIFDQFPHILIFKNGIFNLFTLRFTEGFSNKVTKYYARFQLNYDYDAKADCPNFRRTINRLSKEEQKFLQEYAGHCITL